MVILVIEIHQPLAENAIIPADLDPGLSTHYVRAEKSSFQFRMSLRRWNMFTIRAQKVTVSLCGSLMESCVVHFEVLYSLERRY